MRCGCDCRCDCVLASCGGGSVAGWMAAQTMRRHDRRARSERLCLLLLTCSEDGGSQRRGRRLCLLRSNGAGRRQQWRRRGRQTSAAEYSATQHTLHRYNSPHPQTHEPMHSLLFQVMKNVSVSHLGRLTKKVCDWKNLNTPNIFKYKVNWNVDELCSFYFIPCVSRFVFFFFVLLRSMPQPSREWSE